MNINRKAMNIDRTATDIQRKPIENQWNRWNQQENQWTSTDNQWKSIFWRHSNLDVNRILLESSRADQGTPIPMQVERKRRLSPPARNSAKWRNGYRWRELATDYRFDMFFFMIFGSCSFSNFLQASGGEAPLGMGLRTSNGWRPENPR